MTQHTPSKLEHDYRKHQINKDRRKEEREQEAQVAARQRTPQDDNVRVRGFLSHNTPPYQMVSPFKASPEKISRAMDEHSPGPIYTKLGPKEDVPPWAEKQTASASEEYQERLDRYVAKGEVEVEMSRRHERSVLEEA